MASTSGINPRRNPKRSCARLEAWKFEEDETIFVNDDDAEDTDYCIYSTCTSRKSTVPNLAPGQRMMGGCIVEDYDPAEDVFINDVIKVDFDVDNFKEHIKRFLKTPGVPPYRRAMNKSIKRACAARRPYKRNPNLVKKSTPRKPKFDLTDEDMDKIDTTKSFPRITPVSTLRAMIYTRDFINRLREKRKAAAIEEEENRAAAKLRPNIADSDILKGIVAFVDVISHADEDISSVVKKELEKLGAVVVSILTKNDPVSVIVFNDGHVSTYQKAKKREIPLVSVLWIEECRKIGKQAPMSKFPAYKMERYESPDFIKNLKKRKFMYASERMIPRKERKKRRQTTVSGTPEPESQGTALCEFTPKSDQRSPAWLREIKGSNGMMGILVNMTGVTEGQFREMMEEPEDPEKYENSPLPMRLLHQAARDLSKSSKQSSSPENESTPSSSMLENESTPSSSMLENESTPLSSMLENESTPLSRMIENESTQSSRMIENESTPSSSMLENESEKNIESDESSIIATCLTDQSFVSADKNESNTQDEDTNIQEVKLRKNLTPVPERRVSTRSRTVRRKLSY